MIFPSFWGHVPLSVRRSTHGALVLSLYFYVDQQLFGTILSFISLVVGG